MFDNEDENRPPLHVNIDVTESKKIFSAETTDSPISGVKIFEPELRGERIILPVEFTDGKSDKPTVFGIELDREKLRGLITAYEFDEFIDYD